jgi:hypothetical protein
MKHIKLFEEFIAINEIGNSLTIPKKVNLKKSKWMGTSGEFEYTFNLGGDSYIVFIGLKSEDVQIVTNRLFKGNSEFTGEIKLAIQVDFSKNVRKGGLDLTNRGIPLQVVGAVCYVTLQFLDMLKHEIKTGSKTNFQLDTFNNVHISNLVFLSKGENENDTRRANLYDRFIREQIKKTDIKIDSLHTEMTLDSEGTHAVKMIYDVTSPNYKK